MIRMWKQKPLISYINLLLIGTSSLFFSQFAKAAPALPAYHHQVVCPAGMVADTFANLDYSKLTPNSDPADPRQNQAIAGIKDESYLVVSNSLSTPTRLGDPDLYNATTVESQGMFMLFQNFYTKNDSRTVFYEFKNGLNNQPMPINNFSFSLFDVDTLLNSSGTTFGYYDEVIVKGKTASGQLITPRAVYSGGTMTSASPFSQTITDQTVDCRTGELDGRCQVSLTFDQPIVGFNIEYGNVKKYTYATDAGNDSFMFNNPAPQFIYIRFDSYCYPLQPRLTLTKLLAGNRVNNSDQFTVQIKQAGTVVNNTQNSTTQGTGATVTTGTGTTGVYKIDPNKTYQLTEVGAGTTNLDNYSASYECRNADGSLISTLDPNNIRLNYGDNWTCTVTNAPPGYTFSGTVFHDNGTSSATKYNGIFDSGEAGISGATVKLTNCATNAVIDSVTTSTTGQFEFSYPANSQKLTGVNEVCLVETNASGYTNDTTTNTIRIPLTGVKNYSNNNFGDIKEPLLQLEKFQAIVPCEGEADLSKFDNVFTKNALGKSSSNPNGTEVAGNSCIAYKIVATNLANIPLNQVIISDPLLNSSSVSSKLNANPSPRLHTATGHTDSMASDSIQDNQTGTIKTRPFNLSKGEKATLYFNTKYEKK